MITPSTNSANVNSSVNENVTILNKNSPTDASKKYKSSQIQRRRLRNKNYNGSSSSTIKNIKHSSAVVTTTSLPNIAASHRAVKPRAIQSSESNFSIKSKSDTMPIIPNNVPNESSEFKKGITSRYRLKRRPGSLDSVLDNGKSVSAPKLFTKLRHDGNNKDKQSKKNEKLTNLRLEQYFGEIDGKLVSRHKLKEGQNSKASATVFYVPSEIDDYLRDQHDPNQVQSKATTSEKHSLFNTNLPENTIRRLNQSKEPATAMSRLRAERNIAATGSLATLAKSSAVTTELNTTEITYTSTSNEKQKLANDGQQKLFSTPEQPTVSAVQHKLDISTVQKQERRFPELPKAVRSVIKNHHNSTTSQSPVTIVVSPPSPVQKMTKSRSQPDKNRLTETGNAERKRRIGLFAVQSSTEKDKSGSFVGSFNRNLLHPNRYTVPAHPVLGAAATGVHLANLHNFYFRNNGVPWLSLAKLRGSSKAYSFSGTNWPTAMYVPGGKPSEPEGHSRPSTPAYWEQAFGNS